MNIVVVDIPTSYGMLLSRKFSTNLGGRIYMDLSYALIPNLEGKLIKILRKPFKGYHVKNSHAPWNII